jgi:hypothetical protein
VRVLGGGEHGRRNSRVTLGSAGGDEPFNAGPIITRQTHAQLARSPACGWC